MGAGNVFNLRPTIEVAAIYDRESEVWTGRLADYDMAATFPVEVWHRMIRLLEESDLPEDQALAPQVKASIGRHPTVVTDSDPTPARGTVRPRIARGGM